MAERRDISGRCLCGAVTVRAQVENPILRGCHCEMCQRHTSGIFFSLATVPGSDAVEGPVRTFASSDWAERAFCGTCGSTLWYGTKHDGARNFAAGLFADAAGAPLKLSFFDDLCPRGYGLRDGHKRLDSAATEAMFGGGPA